MTLKRFMDKKADRICYKCKETIPAGEVFIIAETKNLCELCVEDHEEEGRPLFD